MAINVFNVIWEGYYDAFEKSRSLENILNWCSYITGDNQFHIWLGPNMMQQKELFKLTTNIKKGILEKHCLQSEIKTRLLAVNIKLLSIEEHLKPLIPQQSKELADYCIKKMHPEYAAYSDFYRYILPFFYFKTSNWKKKCMQKEPYLVTYLDAPDSDILQKLASSLSNIFNECTNGSSGIYAAQLVYKYCTARKIDHNAPVVNSIFSTKKSNVCVINKLKLAIEKEFVPRLIKCLRDYSNNSLLYYSLFDNGNYKTSLEVLYSILYDEFMAGAAIRRVYHEQKPKSKLTHIMDNSGPTFFSAFLKKYCKNYVYKEKIYDYIGVRCQLTWTTRLRAYPYSEVVKFPDKKYSIAKELLDDILFQSMCEMKYANFLLLPYHLSFVLMYPELFKREKTAIPNFIRTYLERLLQTLNTMNITKKINILGLEWITYAEKRLDSFSKTKNNRVAYTDGYSNYNPSEHTFYINKNNSLIEMKPYVSKLMQLTNLTNSIHKLSFQDVKRALKKMIASLNKK